MQFKVEASLLAPTFDHAQHKIILPAHSYMKSRTQNARVPNFTHIQLPMNTATSIPENTIRDDQQ